MGSVMNSFRLSQVREVTKYVPATAPYLLGVDIPSAAKAGLLSRLVGAAEAVP